MLHPDANIQSHMLHCERPLRAKLLTKGKTLADRVSFGAVVSSQRANKTSSSQRDNKTNNIAS